MIDFLKRFLPFSAIVAVALFGLGKLEMFSSAMDFVWICFVLFFVLAIVTYYFSASTMRQKFSNFMGVFFVSIFAKLILSAIVVMVYKSTNDVGGIAFIAPFALIYFSFLIFETLELVKLSKALGNNAPPKNPIVK